MVMSFVGRPDLYLSDCVGTFYIYAALSPSIDVI